MGTHFWPGWFWTLGLKQSTLPPWPLGALFVAVTLTVLWRPRNVRWRCNEDITDQDLETWQILRQQWKLSKSCTMQGVSTPVLVLHLWVILYLQLHSFIHSFKNCLLICTPMFIAALFIIAKKQKQHKCPSTDEWIKKMWSIYTME